TSCPLPDNASEIAPANSASTAAPSTPTTMPPAIQPPRRAMPWVAASTMPTISPASSTSRKTMSSLASMGSVLLLGGGHGAGGGVGVILVEELVSARLQRPGLHADLAAGHNDLLHPKIAALELGRRVVLVGDLDSEPLARRHRHLGGVEPMILEGQHDGIGRPGRGGDGPDRQESEAGEGREQMTASRQGITVRGSHCLILRIVRNRKPGRADGSP